MSVPDLDVLEKLCNQYQPAALHREPSSSGETILYVNAGHGLRIASAFPQGQINLPGLQRLLDSIPGLIALCKEQAETIEAMQNAAYESQGGE